MIGRRSCPAELNEYLTRSGVFDTLSRLTTPAETNFSRLSDNTFEEIGSSVDLIVLNPGE
jgi:hypothetical protein